LFQPWWGNPVNVKEDAEDIVVSDKARGNAREFAENFTTCALCVSSMLPKIYKSSDWWPLKHLNGGCVGSCESPQLPILHEQGCWQVWSARIRNKLACHPLPNSQANQVMN